MKSAFFTARLTSLIRLSFKYAPPPAIRRRTSPLDFASPASVKSLTTHIPSPSNSEAATSTVASPYSISLARQVVDLVAEYLPKAIANGEDLEARYFLCYAYIN